MPILIYYLNSNVFLLVFKPDSQITRMIVRHVNSKVVKGSIDQLLQMQTLCFKSILVALNKSLVIRDHQPQGLYLYDVPVMYPNKYTTYNKHAKVADNKFLFPFKTKHDVLQKNQPLCFDKSGVNMKAANDLSDSMSHSSARKFTPLQTYQRSMNVIDGTKSKVEGKVENENLIGRTMKTYVSRNPDKNPCLKRKLTSNKAIVDRPSSISKSSHCGKSVNVQLLTKGSRGNVGQPPQPKKEIPDKTNVRIKFHLKPELEKRKVKWQTTQAQLL